MKTSINTPDTGHNPNTKENLGYKQLYRGIWAKTLSSNQKIPVGGSNMFHDEMDKFIVLDFESFDISILTMDKIKQHYDKTKIQYLNWISQCNCKINDFDYFVFIKVLFLVSDLLKVDFSSDLSFEREELYEGKTTIKLSETVGISACAEISLLGKYILQNLGYECSYMSGVAIENPFNEDNYPEVHSFIVIDRGDKSRIFDISRPLQNDRSLPDILETEVKIDETIFENHKNLLVGATRMIGNQQKVYYGVGKPLSGRRQLLTQEGLKTTEKASEDYGNEIDKLIQNL